MSADCPFCAQPVPPQALVCSSCARDITIPPSLIDERDDLIRKRAAASEELANAKAELEMLRLRQRISLRRRS
jgi:hypothetical protein